MPKPKKEKRVQRAKVEEIELLPDAWKRFENGIKEIVRPKNTQHGTGRHRSDKDYEPKS